MWIDIASRINVLYDAELDYHPQFEGYEAGTEIKQADTVLIGYPLMFSMNHSTRVNDLKMYGSATRDSGPAMSFSMYAINYLDIDDEEKANVMLARSYKPHIRQPFNVWNEVVEGEDGATNFMTGAGGFLQTIFNGFLGIRQNLHQLEIRNPRLPHNCTRLQVTGLSYLSSKFDLQIIKDGIFLNFFALNDELNLQLDNQQKILMKENMTCKLNNICFDIMINIYCNYSDNISGNGLVTVSATSDPYRGCKVVT